MKHHITVIKKDRDLHVRVENPDQVVYCHMTNPDLPVITEGRIGLRHMFTRSARYANFRVSRPVPGGRSRSRAGHSKAALEASRAIGSIPGARIRQAAGEGRDYQELEKTR